MKPEPYDVKLDDRAERECPESRGAWYSDVKMCNLTDKVCLLESGTPCEYYEDWLKENNLT